MDPNATLDAFRGALKAAQIAVDGGNLDLAHSYRLQAAIHAEELDNWLSGGGFLPDDWHYDIGLDDTIVPDREQTYRTPGCPTEFDPPA